MSTNPLREMPAFSEAEPNWRRYSISLPVLPGSRARHHASPEEPLDNEVYLLEDIFEPFTDKQVDILRKEMAAIDKEFDMTSSSTAVRIQELPFNKNVPPLVIRDRLVQKFQKTDTETVPSGN